MAFTEIVRADRRGALSRTRKIGASSGRWIDHQQSPWASHCAWV
jgi:hypothetical protein